MDELPTKQKEQEKLVETLEAVELDMEKQVQSENVIDAKINDSLDCDLSGIIDVDDTEPDDFESDVFETELNDLDEVEIVKYRMSDKISIRKFFFELDFDKNLIIDMALQVQSENQGNDLIQVGLMFKYIQQFIREQKFNDYKGVIFTSEIIEAINAKVIRWFFGLTHSCFIFVK